MLMTSAKKEKKQYLLLERFEQKYIEALSRMIDGELCPSIYNNYLSKKNELTISSRFKEKRMTRNIEMLHNERNKRIYYTKIYTKITLFVSLHIIIGQKH